MEDGGYDVMKTIVSLKDDFKVKVLKDFRILLIM